MRLFLAVEPDRAARAGLTALLTAVQNALGDVASAIRWTAPANVHVTLHFLGELDQARSTAVRTALGDRIVRPAFDVETGGLGVFPHGGSPKVVWLSIGAGAAGLTAVYDELAARLRRGGIATEERPFTPHLTLGRVRDRERRRARTLRERLDAIRPEPVRWQAREVVLFRSDLSGPVPRHEPLQVLPFEDGDTTRSEAPTWRDH